LNSIVYVTKWKESFAFFCKSVVWGIVIYLMAKQFAVNNFWIVPVSVFLLSVPICLSGIYSATIKKTHQVTLFVEKGWIYRLFFGRLVVTVFWVIWSLVTSFFMLIQFHVYSQLDWAVFFLVIPVFWCVFFICRKLSSREYKAYLINSMAQRMACWVTALLMLVMHVILMVNYGDLSAYSTISDAIEGQKSLVTDLKGSALVWELSNYLAIYQGFKVFALSNIGELNTLLAFVVLGIGNFVVFYNACAMLSCFLIPKVEYYRIFTPLNNSGKPSRPSNLVLAQVVAVFTFVSIFIYLPSFVYIESNVQQTSELTGIRQRAEQTIEKIDGLFFREGTVDQLKKARLNAIHNIDFSIALLESKADRGFDRLESNVDNYLDWYYSLGGEYARIGHLMVGNLDNYMIEKLDSSLNKGKVFKGFELEFNKVLEENKVVMSEYKLLTEEILNKNKINSIDGREQISQELTLDEVLSLPKHTDITEMKHRLGVGAVVGGIGTVVITKVIGKVAGKGAFKLAVKGLTKLVVSKAAGSVGGATAGAATGAAIGAILPGFGTAIGAVVGGVIGGVAIGLTVDKALIEFESLINREEFKRAILSSIDDARKEFKAGLSG